jgi:hypothetical protein
MTCAPAWALQGPSRGGARAGETEYDAKPAVEKVVPVATISMDSYEGSKSDPGSLHKYLYTNGDPVDMWDASGNQTTMAELGAELAIVGTLAYIAVPQVHAVLNNAGAALYQAGVAVAGNVHDAILAAGSRLSEEWAQARAQTKAEVLAEPHKHQILYHYTSAWAAAEISLTGVMIASDTYSSIMHKGAYATDVEPWTESLTKKELSFGFYGHYNADVSWFVAIDAPDFYPIGTPYDSRVTHWVRAANVPQESVPVNVIAEGPNPMP